MISNLHFLRPYWFLAVIPLALLVWHYRYRKLSYHSWQSICDAGLLPFILMGTNRTQRHWPQILLALSALLVVISLAGPVWKQLEQPVFREQSALVIALDLSRSMDAADITPSRLIRARFKVNDILQRRREGQTALVVYAGDAHVVSPLTDDADTIINLLNTLSTELMPVQGSRADKALELSVKLLQQSGIVAGHILLITDSVDEEQIDALAGLVIDNGDQLSVIGIGTAQGAPISIAGGGYLKDNSGAIVLPKLDAGALSQLAQQGNGRYHILSTDDSDLGYVLGADNAPDFKQQAEDTTLFTDRWREEGPWLLLLVIPLAALVFRRGYLLLLPILILPLVPSPAQALEWAELWTRPDQQAARALQQQDDNVPSADVFKDPAWQAAAHYRSGQYDQTVAVLQDAATADDFYNKGNALARLGRFDEAVSSYDQALQLQPGLEDARYNRDLVKQQLEQMKPNQNEKQNQNQPSADADDSKQGDATDQQGEGDSSSASAADKNQAGNQGDSKRQNSTQQHQGDQSGDDEQKSASSQSDDNGQDSEGKARPTTGQPGQQQADETQDLAEAQSLDNNQGQSPGQGETEQQAMTTADNLKETEAMQANEQWLRMIPDDPGGLLRQKFLYEYQRKQQRQKIVDEASPW
jgi:Ca-activated chloride channel family protein